MKLIVLTENVAGGRFFAEHGLSYYIEHEGIRFLFDTGHSNIFLYNAQKMGLGIQNLIDTVVLSHGHWDHGDGLSFLRNKKLVCHPDVFMKRYRKSDHSYIGLGMSREQITSCYELNTSKEPFYVSEHIIFLGEIPRLNHFEAQTTSFEDEQGKDDFVPDDSAMAIIEGDQLTIISGCAHAGICNTIEYAKQVTGLSKIKTIIGGFHLKKENQQTRETIAYMKGQDFETFYPSHCTELPALAAFYREFGIIQLKTGMQVGGK